MKKRLVVLCVVLAVMVAGVLAACGGGGGGSIPVGDLPTATGFRVANRRLYFSNTDTTLLHHLTIKKDSGETVATSQRVSSYEGEYYYSLKDLTMGKYVATVYAYKEKSGLSLTDKLSMKFEEIVAEKSADVTYSFEIGLNAPSNFSVADKTLTWDAESAADGYNVSCSYLGKVVYGGMWGNSFNLAELWINGTYEISVSSCQYERDVYGSGNITITAESEAATYTYTYSDGVEPPKTQKLDAPTEVGVNAKQELIFGGKTRRIDRRESDISQNYTLEVDGEIVSESIGYYAGVPLHKFDFAMDGKTHNIRVKANGYTDEVERPMGSNYETDYSKVFTVADARTGNYLETYLDSDWVEISYVAQLPALPDPKVTDGRMDEYRNGNIYIESERDYKYKTVTSTDGVMTIIETTGNINYGGYEVDIDGTVYSDNDSFEGRKTISFTMPELSVYKTYTVKARLLGRSSEYYTRFSPSDWVSLEYVLYPPRLSTPHYARVNQSLETVSWIGESEEGSTTYEIRVDGESIGTTKELSYSLSEVRGFGDHKVEVRAVGDGISNSDSMWADAGTFTIAMAESLASPENLYTVGEILYFDKVNNASGYEVNVSGKTYIIDGEQFDLGDCTYKTAYEITVKALGDGKYHADSAASEKIDYLHGRLEIPTNVMVNDALKLVWDDVPYASGYVVKIDDNEQSVQTVESFALNGLTENRLYSLSVRAVGDETRYSDSLYCAEILYMPGRIMTPTDIVVDKEAFTVTFKASSGAGGYLLEIDGAEIELGTNRTYDLKTLITIDSYVLRVKALHPTEELKNSSWSAEIVYDFDSFASGSGTAESPYVISTIAHLLNIRHFPNAHYTLSCSLDFEGYGYADENSLITASFGGTLDGQDFAIENVKRGLFNSISDAGSVSNLTIGLSDTFNTEFDGMFGTNRGTLTNIDVTGTDISFASGATALFVRSNSGSIVGCNVTVSGDIALNNVGFGGFVYMNNGVGKIENANVSIGSVTIANEYFVGNSWVGLFAARNEGHIKDSHATGDLVLDGVDSAIGLFVGSQYNSSASYTTLIEGCTAKGSITQKNVTASAAQVSYLVIGGFIGNIDGGSLTTSSADTVITMQGNTVNNSYIGGFLGENGGFLSGRKSTIQDCDSKGSVTAELAENKTMYVGGFYGKYNTSSTNTALTFTSCIARMGSSSATGAGALRRGGFAGLNGSSAGTYTGCQFNSSLAATTVHGYSGLNMSIKLPGVTYGTNV